ncbi:exodeoxyribonuclease VII large subunit [Chlamydiota bacterium]
MLFNQKNQSSRQILTVSELTRNLKTCLDQQFSSIWVKGEISNLTMHSSGHVYFTLKDEVSQLKTVLFKGYHKGIVFDLEEGLLVMAFGDVSIYEKRGEYQLYVRTLEPVGAGALQLAYEQLKKKLFQEGLCDPSKKKPIPLYPERVGVITSSSGAAIRDILEVAFTRFPGIHIIIFPVRVQGEKAADEISEAIKIMNRVTDVELLIIGRGGGSIEDLWAFNEEGLARAIAASGKPIISAVGHESDWTIADFVADLRMPTPSAASQRVAVDKDELLNRVRLYYEKMYILINKKVVFLKKYHETLSKRMSRLNPVRIIQDKYLYLDDALLRLKKNIELSIQMKKNRLHVLLEKLDILNPIQILSRGYSITKKSDGTVIKEVSGLDLKQKVKTKLYKGSFVSEIVKVSALGKD